MTVFTEPTAPLASVAYERTGISYLRKRREQEKRKKYQPEVEGAERGAETRDCWQGVERTARWARVAEEKNAFVCLALLKALFERRATAPRVVSMAGGWKKRSELQKEIRQRHVEIILPTNPFHPLFAEPSLLFTDRPCIF
jgi:hypothetical protein